MYHHIQGKIDEERNQYKVLLLNNFLLILVTKKLLKKIISCTDTTISLESRMKSNV